MNYFPGGARGGPFFSARCARGEFLIIIDLVLKKIKKGPGMGLSHSPLAHGELQGDPEYQNPTRRTFCL